MFYRGRAWPNYSAFFYHSFICALVLTWCYCCCNQNNFFPSIPSLTCFSSMHSRFLVVCGWSKSKILFVFYSRLQLVFIARNETLQKWFDFVAFLCWQLGHPNCLIHVASKHGASLGSLSCFDRKLSCEWCEGLRLEAGIAARVSEFHRLLKSLSENCIFDIGITEFSEPFGMFLQCYYNFARYIVRMKFENGSYKIFIYFRVKYYSK